MPNVVVTIVGDVSKLNSALKSGSSSVSDFDAKLTSFGASAQKFGKSMSLGVTAPLTILAGLSFRELENSGKALAQTEAAIRSTGGAANVTTQHVTDLAGSLLKLSGTDDEAVQGAENLLLTFTQVRNEAGKGNDIFDQATKAALDLSVAFGKDLNSSAIIVGKALQDPIAGMTSLRKVGVQLSDAQKESIQTFVAQGDIMSAQKVILGELTTKVGGSAEAYGKTLAGQVDIAKESLLNAGASMISTMAPALELLAKLALGAASVLSGLPEPAKLAVGAVLTLVAAIGPLSYVIGKVASALPGMISGFETVQLGAMYAADAVGAAGFAGALGVLATVAIPAAIAGGALLAGAFIDAHGQAAQAEDAAKKWAATQVDAAAKSDDATASITALHGSLSVLTSKEKELHEALTAAQQKQNDGIATNDLSTASMSKLNEEYERAKTRHDALAAALDAYKAQTADTRNAEQQRVGELDQIAAGTLAIADAHKKATDSITAYQNALLAAQGGEIGYEASTLALQSAQENLFKVSLDNTSSQLDLAQAHNAVDQAQLGVVSSALSLSDAHAKLNNLTKDGVQALEGVNQKLREQMFASGDTTGALQREIDKNQEAIDKWWSLHNAPDIHKSADLSWTVADPPEWVRKFLPSFQMGGLMQHTGLAMLHEGEYVLSPDVVRAIKRGVPSAGVNATPTGVGGTPTIGELNVTAGPNASARDIAAEVSWALLTAL